MSRLALIAALALAAAACGDDENTSDAGVSVTIDAAAPPDAPAVDAATIDAIMIDAAVPDAAPPDADPPDAAPPDADPPDADGSVTVMLDAVDDATICSNGNAIGDGALFVGITNEPTVRRALVRFDLSTIPAGSTIAEARLVLAVATIRGTVIVNVHRVTTDWNEGPATPAVGGAGGNGVCGTPTADDATWTATGLGGNWTTAGGDFELLATGSAAVAGASFAVTGLGADVQGWRDSTFANLGWALVATNETLQMNAVKLASPPQLVVRYFPP